MPAIRSRGRGAERDVPRMKPRADAYVGLLILSLLALGMALLFAFLDYSSYEGKPKPVQDRPKQSAGPTPGGPVVNPSGGQPPGGMPGGAPQPKKP